MADVRTTTAVLAADIVPLLIKEQLLMLSERQLILAQLGMKASLPQGSGKTAQWTRYERLPLPSQPIIEGVTPDSVPLTTSIVQAVVDQWAGLVTLTDVAQLTVRHPVLRVGTDRLSTQHAELVEREVQEVIAGGSNVTFGGTGTTRGALSPGDFMTTDVVRKVVSTLRNNGARPREGMIYVGCVDPFVEMDLTKDPTFVTAASYSSVQQLLNGEIGKWMGVRWMRSNFLPIITYLPSAIGAIGLTAGTVERTGDPAADASPQFSFNTLTGGSIPGGLTGFVVASGATDDAHMVSVVITKLDPQTGQELVIQTLRKFANTSAAFVLVVETLVGTTTAGTYGLYVSIQGSTIPVLQQYFTFLTAPGALNGTSGPIVIGAAGTSVPQALPTGGTRSLIAVQPTGAVAPPSPPTTGNVHVSYVFGEEAFGILDLGGLETTLTRLEATDADPLMQRRKLGWKQLFKTVILNDNFYRRIETLSAFN